MIGLEANMDGTIFYQKVRDKVRSLSEDVDGVKIEFKARSTEQVLWTISSSPEDSSRWPECRDALLRGRDQKSVYEGVLVINTLSDI